jgi:hypothetical protein
MKLEQRVARGYLKRSFYQETTLDHVMAGMGMLLAQSVIVSNQFFDEAEIRKYLSIRRQYHETFAEACEDLAEACEAGEFGPAAKAIAHPLQQVAAIPAKDAQRALRLAAKALRGLKSVLAELPREDRRVFRLIRMAYQLAASTEKAYSTEHVEFLKELLKVQILPAPIRTLFRKAIKYVGSTYNRYDDMANVGAWFEMPPERKKKIHETMVEAVKATSTIYQKYKDDPEQQQKLLVENQKRIQRLKNVAGVNVQIIENFEEGQEQTGPSLDETLKKESKLQADGPTEFVQEKIERYFQGSYAEKGTLPREYGKILTQLKKARTIDTVRRVLKGAKERRLMYPEAVEQLEKIWAQAGKNLAVKRGVKLVPLQWEPISAEDFQKKHSTGNVVFDDAMDEKTRQETLGRVSRAIGDLEGIFGKGFCGKHAKPLEFNFEGATGLAAASYFGWENRNNWQPRVKFGDDYAGLLAHELSHYFDDLLANKIDRVKNPEGYDRLRRDYGPGTSELFGRTGVDLEYWVGSGSKEYVSSVIPELGEFADAVVATPDFKRWKDMTGSAHDTALPKAIKNLTGQEYHDLPKGHPYARMPFDTPRYKKDWPPELLAETEKVYREITDGDSRKLTYYNSGIEVWARMCEQYVATKLADAGIANPWLTQLTYDVDELPQMMDQTTFEEKIVPILDKVFATIKEKSLVATRVAQRYLAAS